MRLVAEGLQVGGAEGFLELVVEVGSIGHRDDRGVGEAWVVPQLVGEEHHRVALAGPLRVPHNPAAAVATHRDRNRLHSGVNRVDLVVLGHHLPRPCAVALEQDEVTDQLQQVCGGEDTLDHRLQRRATMGLPVRRTHLLPFGEVLCSRAPCPHPRRHQVRHADDPEVAVEAGDRVGVVVNLIDRILRRLRKPGRLQLELAKRQAVDEQQDVRPAVMPTLDDRELIDREQLIAVGVLEVDELRALGLLDPRIVHVGDRHARGQQLVKAAVVLDQRRRGACHRKLADPLHSVAREVLVDPRNGPVQSVDQHHI